MSNSVLFLHVIHLVASTHSVSALAYMAKMKTIEQHTHTHKLCRTLSVLSLAENGESIEMGCEQIGVKEKISKNRVRTCVKRGKYIVEK